MENVNYQEQNEMKSLIPVPEREKMRESDNFKEFRKAIAEGFAKKLQGEEKLQLFRVRLDKPLSIAFLNAIPEAEDARQHYNCNCCKTFIDRYGSIVTIDPKTGEQRAMIWDIEVPDFFKASVDAVVKLVDKGNIHKPFISDEGTLGRQESDVELSDGQSWTWTHMYVQLPREYVHTRTDITPNQIMALHKENHGLLSRSIRDFNEDHVRTAIKVLKSGSLFRGERFIPMLEWFLDILIGENSSEVKNKKNLRWLAVVNAPAGFVRIRSSMVGTLLEDIAEGMDFDTIKKRFEEKMANYMNSIADPTAGGIAQAEKVVEELGIAPSLRRRYARFEEIPASAKIWADTGFVAPVVETKEEKPAGVFGHLEVKNPKPVQAKLPELDIPARKITWEKFQRDIMPNAQSIEAMVSDPRRMMGLVTSAVEDAKNIIRWDNPFTWYYHGGIDVNIKERVEAAGGKYEDNIIRASLIWENRTDLDIHCITPLGEHIHFGSKRGREGYLDVDANVHGETMTPVENIRFANSASNGRYKFIVHNYTDRNGMKNPFKVELDINGEIYTYEHDGYLAAKEQITVFEFDYVAGNVKMITDLHQSVGGRDIWGIESKTFAKVQAIIDSPNLWGERKHTESGEHTFFILEGAKDESQGKGKGFFVETLTSDLRQIRKVLNAYAKSTPIEGIDEGNVFGLGFSKDGDWNAVLRVYIDGEEQYFEIDRFE